MKLTCDLCGGALQMNSSGQSACCVDCGLVYSIERLREKMGHSQQVVPFAEELALVKNPSTEPQTGFRMMAENVFWIAGKGIVVSGTIENGSVCVGSEVLLNGGKIGKVDAIEMNQRFRKIAQAGDSVGLLLKGIRKSDIAIGDVLTSAQETISEPEEVKYRATDSDNVIEAVTTPVQMLRILRKRSFILFKATVILDGKQCAILEKSGSVTEIPVTRGEHEISFRVVTMSGTTDMEKETFRVGERDLYGVFSLQRNAFGVDCKFEMKEI